jgi:hypothetical protein
MKRVKMFSSSTTFLSSRTYKLSVEGGLFTKRKGTSWKGKEGLERVMGGVNMIKVHYIHALKCHNESHVFYN